MKKIFAVLLVLVMPLSLVCCGNPKYEAPIQIKLLGGNEVVTMVEDFDSERLLEILNEGNWQDGLCDCIDEISFTVSGHKIGYSTSCKTFNNKTNGKSLVLNETEAEEVKEIIKGVLPEFEEENNSELKDYFYDTYLPFVLEGEVLSVSNSSITIKCEQHDKIVVSTNFVDGFGYKSDISNIAVGDRVRVLYDGKVAESYPPQILTVYSINIIELPIID